MAEVLADERLIAAHRALRAQGDVQFAMSPAAGPEPSPAWLKTLGQWVEYLLSPIARLIGWISSLMPAAPWARILLWGMIAALALLALWMAYGRIREGAWRLPRWRRAATLAPADEAPMAWAPDHAPAKRWLDQADALAAEGRFGEAVHHLLLRSIEDIARRRPRLVRPALTSRDLARAEVIPAAPRRLFADLAATVERSLFGGAPVDADDWGRCRAAYAEFALPQGWRG